MAALNPNPTAPPCDAISFELLHEDGPARAGTLRVAKRLVETPAFMPVGTKAAVKGVEPSALEGLGYGLILANTYHLLVRPGPELIRELGGLHRFMGWEGALLTDSGGYQAFSLAQRSKMKEEGVVFRSHLDGSKHALSPERAVEVQETYGSDIFMPLDVCSALPASRDELVEARDRTTRWLRRSIDAWAEPARHALFGIVQGGTEEDLRQEHAEELATLGMPGYSIGGLSVGESVAELHHFAAWTAKHLPRDRPRYLMGVGTPEDLVYCALHGVDMFDCVLPTRSARTGRIYTRWGDLVIKHARFKADPEPLDSDCSCSTCRRFSRAYLRHLVLNRDPLAVRLLTLHNLSYYAELMAGLRGAIRAGAGVEFAKKFQEDRVRLNGGKKI